MYLFQNIGQHLCFMLREIMIEVQRDVSDSLCLFGGFLWERL